MVLPRYNIGIKLFFGEVEFLFEEIELEFKGILFKLYEFNLEVELNLKILLFSSVFSENY